MISRKYPESQDEGWDEDAVVIGYARYSTQGQRKFSTQRQIEKIQDYAAKHGMPDPIIFKDEAVTGATTSRTGLRTMWELVSKHPKGSVEIIIESMSRVARESDVLVDWMGHRLLYGAVVHVTSRGELDDLNEQALGAQAVQEYRGLTTIMRDGKTLAAERGEWMNVPPYGFVLDEQHHLHPHPVHSEIVSEIFARRAVGARWSEIAGDLNERQIESPRGTLWGPSTIRIIVENTIYMGWKTYKPSVFKWEARDLRRELRRELRNAKKAPDI